MLRATTRLLRRDPLSNPEPLIRRVYAYVAYRVGDGPRAEDITSATFERALRYRSSYDASQGEPLAWLIGIARHCIGDAVAKGRAETVLYDRLNEQRRPAAPDLEQGTVERLTIAAALASLPERDRELIVLRYWADMTARQITEMTGIGTNAIEVALHRARGRLRRVLLGGEPSAAPRPDETPAAEAPPGRLAAARRRSGRV